MAVYNSDDDDSLPPTPRANSPSDHQQRNSNPNYHQYEDVPSSPTFTPAVSQALAKTGINMSRIMNKINHKANPFETEDGKKSDTIPIAHPAPDQESVFIVLESSDGFRFVVRRASAVFASRVVRSMLDPNSKLPLP